MPFDEKLGERLAAAMPSGPEVSETRMFGGFGYLVNGNLCCGAHRESFMFRLGKDGYAALEGKVGGLRPMDLTGKVMGGWGMADGDECGEEDLKTLVERAYAFAVSLPPKDKK